MLLSLLALLIPVAPLTLQSPQTLRIRLYLLILTLTYTYPTTLTIPTSALEAITTLMGPMAVFSAFTILITLVLLRITRPTL